MTSEEWGGAHDRLVAAHDEQTRSRERLDAAKGTAREFHAESELRAAREQVTAREAWLEWMDQAE